MKHTLRAVVAVGLLVGVYLLALVIALTFGVLVVLAFKGHLGVFALKLAVVGGLVVAALVRGLVKSLRREPTPPAGVELTREAQPRLWAEVDSLSEQVGVRSPDQIRLAAEVNAAVGEDSRWLGLVPGVRRMYIGVPLLVGLTEHQLRSVLAHELGHYSGRHTALSGVTYRGLEAIRGMASGVGTGWVDKMVVGILGLYARLYVAVSHSVTRAQEYEADAFSAKIAGRDTAVAAMREVGVIAAAWSFYLERYAMVGEPHQRRPHDLLAGFGTLWTTPARQSELEAVRQEPADESTSRYDTHPSTAARIRAFEALPADDRVDTSGPAIGILDAPESALAQLEQDLFAGSPLVAVPWDELIHQVAEHQTRAAAESLATAQVEHGLAVPDLEHLLESLASGAGHLTAGLLPKTAGDAEAAEAATHFLGSTVVAALVAEHGARFRVDWSAGPALFTPDGLQVDVWPLVRTAVEEHDDEPLRAQLAELGVPLTWAVTPRRERPGLTKSQRRASQVPAAT